MSDAEERQSTVPEGATLDNIYRLVQNVANGIAESRGLWGEAEKNILAEIKKLQNKDDRLDAAVRNIAEERAANKAWQEEIRQRTHGIRNAFEGVLGAFGKIVEEVTALKRKVASLSGEELAAVELDGLVAELRTLIVRKLEYHRPDTEPSPPPDPDEAA